VEHGHAILSGAPSLAWLVGLAVAAPLAAPLILFRRPLVRLDDPGPGHPAEERLAVTLSWLGRRADRRLVARILDRLPLLERLGARAAAEPLAERAALAAEGLTSLEEAGAHLDEGELQRAVAAGRASGADVAALDQLRESERLRGVLVADLLRTFSRLDLLCLKLARAEGLDGQGRLAAVAADLDEMRTQLAAEEDIAGLLGPKT
jgi:hypothetical protein